MASELKRFIDRQLDERRETKAVKLQVMGISGAHLLTPEREQQIRAELSAPMENYRMVFPPPHMSVRRCLRHGVCVLEQPDGLNEVWEQAGRDPNATIMVHTFYYDTRLGPAGWSSSDQGTK